MPHWIVLWDNSGSSLKHLMWFSWSAKVWEPVFYSIAFYSSHSHFFKEILWLGSRNQYERGYKCIWEQYDLVGEISDKYLIHIERRKERSISKTKGDRTKDPLPNIFPMDEIIEKGEESTESCERKRKEHKQWSWSDWEFMQSMV